VPLVDLHAYFLTDNDVEAAQAADPVAGVPSHWINGQDQGSLTCHAWPVASPPNRRRCGHNMSQRRARRRSTGGATRCLY